MSLIEILTPNPYGLYKEHCGDALFENEIHLVEHLFEAAAKSYGETEYDRSEVRLFLERVKEVQDPDGTRFYVPFIFHPRRENLILKIKESFPLSDEETERLRSIVFNFAIKSFIENKFGIGFIKTIFEHIDALKIDFGNHFKQMDSTFEKTKNIFKENKQLIDELEISHKKQIQEQKDIFHKTVPLSKLTENEGLELIKTDVFPDLFKRGRPQTMAFNEFVFSLYQLCLEKETYMPFIQKVIHEIKEINPDYFLRTEISESAIRKKINELKKKS